MCYILYNAYVYFVCDLNMYDIEYILNQFCSFINPD